MRPKNGGGPMWDGSGVLRYLLPKDSSEAGAGEVSLGCGLDQCITSGKGGLQPIEVGALVCHARERRRIGYYHLRLPKDLPTIHYLTNLRTRRYHDLDCKGIRSDSHLPV